MIKHLECPKSVQLDLLNSGDAVLTEKGIIASLKGITEQRYQAISAYPSSRTFHECIGTITLLRNELNAADAQLNYKSAVKICLRLENALLYLAPRSTMKIFNTYKAKVDFLMEACRIILNYKAQQS